VGGREVFLPAAFAFRTHFADELQESGAGFFLRPKAKEGLLSQPVSNPASRVLGFVGVLVSLVVVVLTLTPPNTNIEKYTAPLLPRASLLRIGGRAFLPLLADYYWLAAIQASGKANSEAEYRDLADYAQLITDLDPDFAYVYQFGGTMVPYNRGRETWVNTRESTAILEKGVARFPNSVMLRTLLAYNYSVFQKEYERAAHILEETARLPGTPRYLSLLATRLYAQAGAFEAASAFADQFAATADDPDLRAAFEHRKKEIALERILQLLDRAVADFHQRIGRLPNDLNELVSSGTLESLPADPLEGDLYLGEDGRTYSTSQEHRLEVWEPHKGLKQ
jgi:hypothetical protein